MKQKRRFSEKQVLEFIPESKGILSDLAALLGVTYKTALRYIKEYPNARDAFNTERMKLRGLAESKIFEKLQGKDYDLKTIVYVLSHIKPIEDTFEDVEDFSKMSDEELNTYEQIEINSGREV